MCSASAFISLLYSSKVFCHSLSNFQCKIIRHMSDQCPKLSRFWTHQYSPIFYTILSILNGKSCSVIRSQCTLACDIIYSEECKVQGEGGGNSNCHSLFENQRWHCSLLTSVVISILSFRKLKARLWPDSMNLWDIFAGLIQCWAEVLSFS